MGVVQSFLKGRRPREKNWCSVASSSSIRRILKSQNGSCAKLSERADTSKKFGVLLKNCAKLSERRIPQENVVFCWKSVKHKKKNTQEFKMGVVRSYVKGRIPQENLVFCWKFVKHKKKNTQEFKMGVVQSYLKGRILQENLVFCRKFVKYKKKNTQGLKWELFKVI
jgi:hypothetical protein